MGVTIRGVYFPSLTEEDRQRIEEEVEQQTNWFEGINHMRGMCWLLFDLFEQESPASTQEFLGYALHAMWYNEDWLSREDPF